MNLKATVTQSIDKIRSEIPVAFAEVTVLHRGNSAETLDQLATLLDEISHVLKANNVPVDHHLSELRMLTLSLQVTLPVWWFVRQLDCLYGKLAASTTIS